jgi:hypothetical protein
VKKVLTPYTMSPTRRSARQYVESYAVATVERAAGQHGSTVGVSERLTRTRFAQALLGALQLLLEFAEAGGGSETPPVEPGAQQRDTIVAVVHVGLRELNLARRAHESNSNTAYA